MSHFRNSLSSNQTVTENREWIKVANGDVSIFYSKTKWGHRFFKTMRILENSPTQTQRPYLMISGLLVIFFFFGAYFMCSKFFRTSLEEYSEGEAVSRAYTIETPIKEEPGQKSPLNPTTVDEVKSSMRSNTFPRKHINSEASVNRKIDLDPFRCSPATNSRNVDKEADLEPL
ncbi:MAG: hypothetical protein RJB13_2392, partial [Pseudomonadota bacterium]